MQKQHCCIPSQMAKKRDEMQNKVTQLQINSVFSLACLARLSHHSGIFTVIVTVRSCNGISKWFALWKLRELQCNLHTGYAFNIIVYWRNITEYIYIILPYILDPHVCAHICVRREICYSKVIVRESKLKIFMLYLRVTWEKDFVRKQRRKQTNKKPPNPQVERENNCMETKYYQYFVQCKSWGYLQSSETGIFSFVHCCFILYHASSISYPSQLV